jgi:hypothetical protein
MRARPRAVPGLRCSRSSAPGRDEVEVKEHGGFRGTYICVHPDDVQELCRLMLIAAAGPLEKQIIEAEQEQTK